MQPSSTQQFGRYVLQRRLAEGGMAEVFLAKQSGLEGFEKLVVVKRILPQLCSDESFVKMFLNEARVAARLNHPNVVQIFDLGKLDDQYFIAMEYVHGEDLRAIIRELTDAGQKPPLALSCRIIADTLAGLHYAHTRVGADGKPLGLVHRDVSPQNVLVTFEGTIKLVDFGIAKATREVGAAQTQAGLLKGKYAYMAPEQARGQAVDARSDVFCAGILLWEMATWQRLFKRPTELATLMAVAEEPVRAPRTVEPSLPPELDRLILKALARKPEDRFQSAQEFRAALEHIIRTSRWEADTLALSTWMRALFAKKLRAQAADVAAAGLASLEDFLLTVEEKTKISWMVALPTGGDKKTPSRGLPAAKPLPAAPPPAEAKFEEEPTAEADPHLVNRLKGERKRATTLPDSPAHPPVPPVALYGDGETQKVTEVSGVIAESVAQWKSTPSAPTVDVVAPEAPKSQDTPSMNLAPERNPIIDALASTTPMPSFGSDKSTAKSMAIADELPSPLKRVLVAGSAALLVAAVALTVVFWPAKQPAPTTTVVPPAIPSAPPTGDATKPQTATLVIKVDAPAAIAVDGQAQPPGESATVSVQPGVEHIVTVQRAGHSVRRLHVPALAPGERMPLSFTVR